MTRLERVREKVEGILDGLDPEYRRMGFAHLNGVSVTAVLLAHLRGLDAELAAAAGLLHDLAAFETGDNTDHALRGAARAASILEETSGFSREEIAALVEAISRHSSKGSVHGPFAELLKDADVLHHRLHDPVGTGVPGESARFEALKKELGLGRSGP